MRRREFISLITSAAAWPFAARGQVEKVYRIGVLEPTPAIQNVTNLNALRAGSTIATDEIIADLVSPRGEIKKPLVTSIHFVSNLQDRIAEFNGARFGAKDNRTHLSR